MMKIEEIQELMGKATPGPWRNAQPQIFQASSGETIANCGEIIGWTRQDWANASFIAALPDIAVLAISLDAERRRNGWQPIETAPKNGSGILLVSGAWITSGCWNKHRNEWCINSPTYPPYPDDEQPTGWMPLPSPPTSTQNEKEN